MKPRIHIEFLPPGRPPRWAWALSAAVGAVALASAGLAIEKALELRHLRAEIAVLEAQRAYAAEAASVPAASAVAPAPPYDADARIAWRESRFATAPALTALESVAMLGVSPVSVEMDAASGVVRVELEFSDHAALLAYLAALNVGEDARRWTLVQARGGKGDKLLGMAVVQARW